MTQVDPESPPTAADLAATDAIDSESTGVGLFVAQVTEGTDDAHEVVRRLFTAVRDGVRYDPYRFPTDVAEYRASAVLAGGSGYCVQKSVALTAAARAAGIPSRLGFADVRNHLQTDRMRELMGTDEFLWHAYSLFYVGGRWTKASCAFNAELCERMGVEPLDFDGTNDALLHPFSGDGSQYMEYVNDRGAWTDLPLETLIGEIDAAYPGLVGERS